MSTDSSIVLQSLPDHSATRAAIRYARQVAEYIGRNFPEFSHESKDTDHGTLNAGPGRTAPTERSGPPAAQPNSDALKRLSLQCEALLNRMGISLKFELSGDSPSGVLLIKRTTTGLTIRINSKAMLAYDERQRELILAHSLACWEWSELREVRVAAAEAGLLRMLTRWPSHRELRTTLFRLRLLVAIHCDFRAANLVEDQAGLISLVESADDTVDGTLPAIEQELPAPTLNSEERMHWKTMRLASLSAPIESRSAPLDENLCLESLDLMQQEEIRSFSLSFAQAFLSHQWMFTTPVLEALPELGLTAAEGRPAPPQERVPAHFGEDVRQYLCLLLLDVVMADLDIVEPMLAAAFLYSEGSGIAAEFEQCVITELEPGKRLLQQLREDGAEILKTMSPEPGQ